MEVARGGLASSLRNATDEEKAKWACPRRKMITVSL